MAGAERSFQVFVKPVGAACNLACRYCYYLDKGPAATGCARPLDVTEGHSAVMPDDLLETYIAQHIAASPDEVVRFSWHGGEPTLAGLDFFRRAVAIQRKFRPAGRVIANGLQTNGTLLDDEWGEFLAAEGFAVGLSLDGPRELHDPYRLTRSRKPTFAAAVRGWEILRRYGVASDVLCVVSAANVGRPQEVYRFFKSIGAAYITFLPLVERRPRDPNGVSPESVPALAWGDFLCAVFDEWAAHDIGRVKVQVVEEAARTAFGLEHSLCIFRRVCGDIPVLELDGTIYCCDHYVDEAHRLGDIRLTPLVELLESPALRSFGRAKLGTLPRFCRECEYLEMCNGECPKNRFLQAPDGEPGLNYLCRGYRKFFAHVRPFVDAVAAEWRRGRMTKR